MSFVSNLFHNEKKAESVVLIDIGTSSVAGAYAQYKESEMPVLLYTRRVPIETREEEPEEKAMLRALQILAEALIREGAPVLARATGSGSAHTILVSIDAPWQETSMRNELYENKVPYVFSKSFVAETLKKTRAAVPGKLLADESIIGTILNGYRTHNPYGTKVHRSSIIILTSLIDEKIAEGVASILRSLYHTKRILLIAGSSHRYQAMRIAFPHERDALILDATGPLTSISLVRKNLLVAVKETPTTGTWIEGVRSELVEITKQFPLPRTIFLLAKETEIISLQETLDKTNLGELWLSDNPPKIVAVLASHFNGLVKQVTTASPDLELLLMTLYWQSRASGE